MTTKVQICNMALGAIGEKSNIQSITERSPQAAKCNLYYDQMVEVVLSDFDWNFASVTETLALIGTAPTGWSYQYAMPSDCLAAREIVREIRINTDRIPYKIARDRTSNMRVILTNQAEAELRYTGLVTDTSQFSPWFVEALSLRLSAAIAEPLTRKKDLVVRQLQLYNRALQAAAAASANEEEQEESNDADWIRDRE
ncbi:MAG: hypothetical protein N0E44_18935 [Candidatus Thiodiazotropha lotti]|nr:hypothetical protein [Candidatus Thiodiazotropha lotti]MCW4221961.1 hypothetical protein [Candidatus Thiodiazotropha lotti]